MRRFLTLLCTLSKLCIASMALLALCSCSWQKYLPAPDDPTLPNVVAIDRALRLSSLTQGEQPFHLVLSVATPEHATGDMSAQVELSWLNPLTYRTVIRSRDFTQVRIVNSGVVEEHNTGAYYPRWIQNFVDALLEPIPNLATLRKIPGDIPIGPGAHACISTASSETAQPSGFVAPEPDPTRMARICFQGSEPRLASSLDFSRSIWFDDFASFGHQQVPHTLVNALPANLQARGHIIRLEPLSSSDQKLLKAHEYTPPAAQILTTTVPESTARSMLLSPSPEILAAPEPTHSITIYIRTDRTGKVREAYRANSDNAAALYSPEDPAVFRALTFRFKPLVMNGVPYQMEAPLSLPSKAAVPTP
jgi:hypothetical protein